MGDASCKKNILFSLMRYKRVKKRAEPQKLPTFLLHTVQLHYFPIISWTFYFFSLTILIANQKYYKTAYAYILSFTAMIRENNLYKILVCYKQLQNVF